MVHQDPLVHPLALVALEVEAAALAQEDPSAQDMVVQQAPWVRLRIP